ncbi:TFIIS central domain-containing protein [Plasmodiophora brassicae]|nr:hypothetical protein PBRA_001433 [Plasmodiophora brassicae]
MPVSTRSLSHMDIAGASARAANVLRNILRDRSLMRHLSEEDLRDRAIAAAKDVLQQRLASGSGHALPPNHTVQSMAEELYHITTESMSVDTTDSPSSYRSTPSSTPPPPPSYPSTPSSTPSPPPPAE